jgi:hypothetical protein
MQFKDYYRNLPKGGGTIPSHHLTIKKVIEFFKENPYPSDDHVHAWAEEKRFDVHEVEALIYTLATKFVNLMTGGLSGQEGIEAKDVDQHELAQGIEVEYEHTPDKDVAEKIALDHLTELRDYYTRLKRIHP